MEVVALPWDVSAAKLWLLISVSKVVSIIFFINHSFSFIIVDCSRAAYLGVDGVAFAGDNLVRGPPILKPA
jgi:hypothetical protein